MIDIIYLAGGCSKRFGANKLLYLLEGKEIYRHSLDKLIELSETRDDIKIILVSQYEYILHAYKNKVETVMSPESYKGLSYSIKAGLRHSHGDYIMFVAADEPYIKEETFARVIEKISDDTEIVRVYYNEIPGNPVLFSSSLRSELMGLTGDEGGRNIIKNHKVDKVFLSSEKELRDIDYPEDIR